MRTCCGYTCIVRHGSLTALQLDICMNVPAYIPSPAQLTEHQTLCYWTRYVPGYQRDHKSPSSIFLVLNFSRWRPCCPGRCKAGAQITTMPKVPPLRPGFTYNILISMITPLKHQTSAPVVAAAALDPPDHNPAAQAMQASAQHDSCTPWSSQQSPSQLSVKQRSWSAQQCVSGAKRSNWQSCRIS
jgi:hypothetical protein